MKRGGPLRRTPISRTAWRPKPRRPLPARSAKREAIADERRQFVADALHRRPWCEAHELLYDLALVAGPVRAASVDVHELLRRSQGGRIVPSQGLTDDDWLALCRACHTWITEHPREAVALGLARWGIRRTL